MNVMFEGMKVKKSLLRKLPIQRGKDKFKANPKPLIINLELLNLFPSEAKVNIESLAKMGIVKLADAQEYGVKILGKGDLKKKLIIELPISKQARQKVEAKKGKVV